MLFVPAKTSRAWPSIQRSGKFCVNFLADDQAELSNQMASRGVDKFAGLDWSPAPETGSPMFAESLGYVDCQIHSVHEAGDHFVVIGRVLDLGVHAAEKPLLFFQGKYADRLVGSSGADRPQGSRQAGIESVWPLGCSVAPPGL